MVDLSIVIPTYNRRDVLVEVLDNLAQCTREGFTTETIVVDDGSTDGSREAVSGRKEILYFGQENSGPATARNRGTEAASGRFVLFLGDDIIPDRNLLTVHMAALRKEPEVSVLGYVGWDPAIPVTPFMRFLTDSGIQFDFANITDPENVSWQYFYTANISLARKWLLDESFDQKFRWACVEDVELAFRLAEKGLRIVYRPEATGLHRHAITLQSYLRRCIQSGKSAVLFHQKHPQVPIPNAEKKYSCWFRTIAPALNRMVNFLDRRHISLPGSFYTSLTGYYFLRGFEEEMVHHGIRERSDTGERR